MTDSQVLVVDDEADIRALISDILSDEGYGVTVAADAAEARTAKNEPSIRMASHYCGNGPMLAI